jgi:23S rRNA (uracil1939-C5)-methyltransferase
VVQFYKTPKPRNGKRQQARLDKTSHRFINNLYVNTIDHHGKGVVLSTTPLTMVQGALPEETVTVNVSAHSKQVQHAQVVSVQLASPIRVVPPCAVYEQCGGCSLQIAGAEDGLLLKQNALKRYVRKMLNIDERVWQPAVHSAFSSVNQMGYRRKVRLAVDARQRDKIKIGYRQDKSHQVVDISTCPILAPALKAAVELLLPDFRAWPGIDKVGHIECTLTVDGVIVLVHLAKPISRSQQPALEQISEHRKIRLICRVQDQITADFGQAYASLVIEDIPGLRLEMAPHHFIQINGPVNHNMIAQALDWLRLSSTSVVHDFYCGLGNFSLALACCCESVSGYEVSGSMVAQARHNAVINGCDNLTFSALNLDDVHDLQQLSLKQSDAVLLDPAREGAQRLCEYLVKRNVSRILYVSCNPNTLIRDLKILNARYTVKAMGVLDMFPFTQHLETMALLDLT